MRSDPIGALADPVINDWLGRRLRNIFIEGALADPAAVRHSRATQMWTHT
ncbi:MAG: hypothetical protein ACOYD1_06550 [Candidatus Nanopelagicales bacterium]